LDGVTVMRRADELGAISQEPGILVRAFGSDAMRRANELVGGWMRGAEMSVREDAVGNLIGRRVGDGERVLVLGSHLDTVRDAGRYDGPLGVLVALATVERLARDRARLPFAIEVVAFADEEGLRFGTTYLGSSAFTGRFDPALLALVDREGVTLAEAVRAFGGSPEQLAAGHPPDDLIGYCEVHIEQGPTLERRGLPVGVVTAITGQSRITAEYLGEAGHAGTTPMEARRDALCAAAELVLAVERLAHEHEGMVATVGRLQPHPDASNVIPGSVTLSIDLRDPDDSVRKRACADLRHVAAQIGERRSVELRWERTEESESISTDPTLSGVLAHAVADARFDVERLPSGAGHDGAELAAIAPVAMLFVRCAGGVSHNPAEAVDLGDVEVAIDVLQRFVVRLAEIEADRLGGVTDGR
jgi:allantoate deiminase